MTTNKRTIAIGDIHGRTNWKDIVNAEENKGCHFVFLGDYFDPYDDIRPYNLFDNMLDIIFFKKKHMNDVTLLLGNHDMHYIDETFCKGTRYDDTIAHLISALFSDYRELFQYAYQEGNTIYTHAGISNAWWQHDFLPLVDKSSLKYNNGILDIAALLNNATPAQLQAMFQISYWRGGDNENGGIFWADKNETFGNPLKGYYQVVGHTQVHAIQTNSTDAGTQITFADCLATGAFHSQPSKP